MRSLFLKIFVWFWLAMALVGVALLAMLLLTRPGLEPAQRDWLADGLQLQGRRMAAAYEGGGPELLRHQLERLATRRRFDGFLFDTSGRELAGRPVPEPLLALVAQIGQSDEKVFLFDGPRLLGVVRVQPLDANELNQLRSRGGRDGGGRDGDGRGGNRDGGGRDGSPWTRPNRVPSTAESLLQPGGVVQPSGNIYIFAATMERPALSVAASPLSQVLRVTAVIVMAGLVCFLLARSITAPVVALQKATRRLASGDLAARVAPSLGRRGDELAALAHDFDLMADHLQDTMESQKRLLGDVSHELRSPLTRLGLALELARRKAGHEAEPHLNRIGTEAERLNELIGQLLTLARLDSSGEGATHGRDSEPVDLAALLHQVVADADFEARNRGSQVVLSIAETCREDCRTRGSHELLRRAVENVLRNAVEYSNGQPVEVSLSRVDKAEGKMLLIRVRDHGCGVPEASLDKLFRPFYRVAEARERSTGGAGWGFPIAERAIRSHGGTAIAHNAPEGGLVVELSLPARS